MPAKSGKERSLLERFISVYENDSWADAHRDWVDEREDGAVELIATRKSDGATLAIEHTVVQPYPREKEDFARFDRAFMRGTAATDLEVPGAILWVDVPAGTLRAGDDWNGIAYAVHDCIRTKKRTVPQGHSQLACRLADGRTVNLQVRRERTDGDGQTIIRRYGPFDLQKTVRTAVENKLPKLLGTKVDKHLLMLERDQWHVDHKSISSELERLPGEFPLLASLDEIWIAETHENRRIVLFDLVRPGGAYDPVFTFVGTDLLSRHDR